MAIYGIGVIPLISMLIDILSNEYSANVKVMAYADDLSAAGNLQDLRRWWSVLTEFVPKLGYYPEPTKTWLAKPCASEKVESVFFGVKMKITTESRRYYGGSVGTQWFKDLYITTKVNDWISLYGWPLPHLPNMCSCGAKYDLQHSLSCKKGGFVTLRHNHLRNIAAKLIDQVCHDVRVEPPLQTLTGEMFDSRSTDVRDEARLDISARGFWTKYQIAFFDVRFFDPNAKRYEGKPYSNVTEQMKWRRNVNITSVFCKLKMEVSPH